MGNVGLQEVLVIAFIALLVFGPDRLPELAREAGKLVARFRQETSKSVAELKKAAELEDLDRELRAMRAELRDLGREITGGLEDATASTRGSKTPARTQTGPPRPRDRPPPVDPEAT